MTTVKTIPEQVEQYPSTQSAIPQEWLKELALLPEGSYERQQFLATLDELGIAKVVDDQNEMNPLGEPPEGFAGWERIPDGSRLRTNQFGGHLHALDTSEEYITTDTVEFETDQGNKVRLVDLRSHTTASMRKIGPKTEREQEILDEHFLRDVKLYADRSLGRHHVVNGHPLTVNYTHGRKGTKQRAYWVLVKDENNPEKVPTIARIGDIGNDERDEERFYNRQLGLPYRLRY